MINLKECSKQELRDYARDWISANCCDGDDRSAEGDNGINDIHSFNSPDLYELVYDLLDDLLEEFADEN